MTKSIQVQLLKSMSEPTRDLMLALRAYDYEGLSEGTQRSLTPEEKAEQVKRARLAIEAGAQWRVFAYSMFQTGPFELAALHENGELLKLLVDSFCDFKNLQNGPTISAESADHEDSQGHIAQSAVDMDDHWHHRHDALSTLTQSQAELYDDLFNAVLLAIREPHDGRSHLCLDILKDHPEIIQMDLSHYRSTLYCTPRLRVMPNLAHHLPLSLGSLSFEQADYALELLGGVHYQDPQTQTTLLMTLAGQLLAMDDFLVEPLASKLFHFLDQDASLIHQQDEEGNTLLHYACGYIPPSWIHPDADPDDPLLGDAPSMPPSLLTRLIQYGFNPFVENHHGLTPLDVLEDSFLNWLYPTDLEQMVTSLKEQHLLDQSTRLSDDHPSSVAGASSRKTL